MVFIGQNNFNRSIAVNNPPNLMQIFIIINLLHIKMIILSIQDNNSESVSSLEKSRNNSFPKGSVFNIQVQAWGLHLDHLSPHQSI
jgi:hypothetical protein